MVDFKTHIFKMSVLPKLIYRYNTISIIISIGIFKIKIDVLGIFFT